jgi:hypothetical protein
MAKLAYILAASHSGSTLLAMLLGAHREACSVGELKATSLGDIEKYRCSCRELIKQCPFWTQVSQRMAQRGIAFEITDAGTDFCSVSSRYLQRLLRPLHRGRFLEWCRGAAMSMSPTWRRRLPEIQHRNTALIETVCELTGTKIIIDSSKSALRLKYLLENPALDVKVIRLIRDGRAVALTYVDPATYANASDPTMRVRRPAPQLSFAEASYQWRRSNEATDHLLAQLDRSCWLELRYEEYCVRRDATLKKAFSFLGLDPTRPTPAFRSVQHHVVGNVMRLDQSSDVRLDDRWRSVLATEELGTFEKIAGKLNRKYGY